MKKFMFKLIGGPHIDRTGREYQAGDIVESDVDLCRVFRGKFLKLTPEQEAVERAKKAKAEVKAPDEYGEGEDIGRDVTIDFPKADKKNVTIYRKGNWYTLVDKKTKQAITEKKIRKATVRAMLKNVS